MTLKHFTACALLAASLDAQAVHANGTQPSFDCAKAISNAEELVCAEARLAALDRRLSAHYAAAVDKLGALDSGTKEALAALRATQRGWIKGRDECWKSVDLRACVKASYLQREAELVATWLLEDPASVVSFSCDGNPANEITAMFFDTELPGVRLEYGDSIDTGTLSPAASGSRYEASFGRFLWIKGDTATVSWTEGHVMSCVLQD